MRPQSVANKRWRSEGVETEATIFGQDSMIKINVIMVTGRLIIGVLTTGLSPPALSPFGALTTRLFHHSNNILAIVFCMETWIHCQSINFKALFGFQFGFYVFFLFSCLSPANVAQPLLSHMFFLFLHLHAHRFRFKHIFMSISWGIKSRPRQWVMSLN